MLSIIAWLIIGVCTYKLLLSRFDNLCGKWGGLIEYLKMWGSKDPEMYGFPKELYAQTTKAILLLFSLLLWPLVLLWLLKTYLPGYEKKFEDQLNKE